MIKDSYGNTRFFGIYRGVVFDTNDPLGRARIRVKVPQVLADNPTEWAWPIGTSYSAPSVGDGVLVQFEGGDPSYPLWNTTIPSFVIAGELSSGTAVTPADLALVAATGLPEGGEAGQILAKIDQRDYNVEWINEAPAASYTSTIKHEVKLGQAISKGQAVYVSSADGTNMVVSKASNSSEATSSKTMGLLETSGSTNAKVNVITEGLLSGLDTSSGNAGDPVWLGTDGNLIYGLSSKPIAPAHLVFIGVITRKNSNNGEIFVRPQNGFELNEIHNVLIGTNYSSTPADNDLLAYDTSSSLWKNKTPAQAGLATVSDLGELVSDLGELPKSPNYLINGGFDFWQRGTSFSSPAALVYLADRWTTSGDGTGNKTISRQAFGVTPVPQVGHDSLYFYRYQQTSSGTGTTYRDVLYHKVEGVDTLAGETVTLSFWAKSNATRSITTYLGQDFGTGGTPSSVVYYSGATVSIGTSWTKYTTTITLSSLAGKTIGTNGNDSLQVIIRTLTNNATQTIDIWGVQLELGSTATPFRRAGGDLTGEQLACYRYYQRHFSVFGRTDATGVWKIMGNPLGEILRGVPSSVIVGTISTPAAGGNIGTNVSLTIGGNKDTYYTSTGSSSNGAWLGFDDVKIECEL